MVEPSLCEVDDTNINSSLNNSDDFLPEVEPFELEDLSIINDDNKPITSNVSAIRDEKWLLLERSNIFKRFLFRVWYGPREPKDEPPTFPSKFKLLRIVEEYPENGFNVRFPSEFIRKALLIVYCSIWFSAISLLIHNYLFKKPYFYSNDGNERIPIVTYGCNSYLNWKGKNNACGIGAKKCAPFEDKEYFIRCPALCDRGGWTYSAIEVGDRRVKYTGYEIGGGENSEGSKSELSYPYRADSFVCGSGVHAGVISPTFGGCARISMEGSQSSFPSQDGKHNTHFSVAFNSFFPSSFVFKSYFDGIANGCTDPRALIVFLNILFGLPVFYLYESITSYWICTMVGYWTLVLALDPPLMVDPHDMGSVYELFSVGFQRLLPLCFLLYVMWKSAVKRTLENGSPVAKILLWYPLLWLGIMNNITFDRLPVDRLTPKDLKEQAGAATAVACIAGTILTCAVIQAYSLWKSGRFRKFFKIYISFILGLILLSSIPGLHLRIHHYILGTVLVPGCATRGSSAYLFQGILIGLILSGVSRWDFASIVETDFALLRGEAGSSSAPPTFQYDTTLPHSIGWHLNQTDIEMETNKKLDAFSLLLNDFEVYVGKNSTIDLDELFAHDENVSRMIDVALEGSTNNTVNMYLRVARASSDGTEYGDYTNAGILKWPSGGWLEPAPGVS